MKTLLVVGSAPCIHEDVQRALQLRPFAGLLLVNGACTAIKDAEYMLCGHTEKAEQFAAERRRVYPGSPIKILATCNQKRLAEYKHEYPSVTDWWPEECGVGATSVSKGAKIGFMLGFEEIILCGSPMDGSGYVETEAKVQQSPNCLRIGDSGTAYGHTVKVQESRMIKAYRTRMAELAQGEFQGRVFSMSGFTRDVLGEPKEI